MRTAAHIAHATHASLSQHSIGSDSPVHSLVILGCLGQVVTGLSLSHPRRPRGSQSGREKWWDESFQVRVKEPLGTGSHQAISKNSSGCRLLIGHKKCFVLLCPIGKQFLLSSFREFVHDSYCLVRARETFISTFLTRNGGTTDESKKRLGCYQQEQFNLPREYSVFDSSQYILNNRKFKMRRRRESQKSNSLTRRKKLCTCIRHTFLYISLPSTARLPVKMSNQSCFVKDVNKQWQNSFSS